MGRFMSKFPSIAPLCFFLISVAYKLAWTAISSLLSQYSKAYGPNILLQLNVAYFFPSIPVLMLQALFNDRMDRRLGVPGGVLLRFIAGLGGLVALTRFFPVLTAPSEQALLITTVLVGMAYGIAFGTSYQIASKYAAASTVALTTGFVSSGPVVLLLDLALKRGPYYSPEELEELFRWVSVITAVGLAAAALLVLGSWRMLATVVAAPHRVELNALYKTPSSSYGGGKDVHVYDRAGGGGLYARHRADGVGYDAGGGPGTGGLSYNYGNSFHNPQHNHQHHGLGQAGHHAITLDFSSSTTNDHHNHHLNGHAGGGAIDYHLSAVATGSVHDQSADESKVAKRDLPLLHLATRILPAALSITISVGTSMLIFPFFTYMNSTGLLGDRLPQVLFYIRLVGDILGRLVPRRLQVDAGVYEGVTLL